MNILIKNWWNNIDQFNFIAIISLLIIGTLLSFSINDSFFLIQKHLFYAMFSIFIILYLSFLKPKTIRRLALLGLVITSLLMIIVLLMSYEVNGAKRWIKISSLSIQPSEFLKPFFLIISGWFLSKGIENKKISLYIVFSSFLFLTTLLILQPDFGMTMLFAISFFCQLFIAGLSLSFIIISIFLLILLSLLSYFMFDHVQLRVEMFFDSNVSYQISKSLNAFKSGGLFGKGPGQGILKEKLPEAHTDFIFAVAGEELGFVVCCIIVLLFLLIIIRTLLKLLQIQNSYIIIAIIGLTSSFGLQALINILCAIDLIPTTGMTLPFISYGGSSMLATAILFGFLLSLTKKTLNE